MNGLWDIQKFDLWLGIALTKMYWLLGRKPKLSTSNKLLIYKTILKPIWTYGIQLWGTASTSNIDILERFQWKALRMIVDVPRYVPNTVIRWISKYQLLKKKSALQLSIQCSPRRTSKWPNSKPHGATRQQAIVVTPAK
jgi:hypothetical protein